MKIEAEIHPVGSERYFCDLSFDVLKVRVESIRILLDHRWPDEILVYHSIKPLEVAHSPMGRTEVKRIVWQDPEFADLFEDVERAKAQRDERLAQWRNDNA